MLFSKLTFTLCQDIRLFCQQFILICYLGKALPGNVVYKMKVCLNIDVVFKPFEIVVLDNFHDKYLQQSKKKLLYFYPFLFF